MFGPDRHNKQEVYIVNNVYLKVGNEIITVISNLRE